MSMEHIDRNTVKILVLYTGGTIGMVEKGGVLAPDTHDSMLNQIRITPQLHDPSLHRELKLDDSQFVLRFTNNKTVLCTFLSYMPLLDSSNMGSKDWIKIAEDIQVHYTKYDGFLVLHGTDTLAYTSSALSFMLQNLRKPVIVTGSQLPIFDVRTDAISNIMCSLYVASCCPTLSEVVVVFGGKVFHGNRVLKVDNASFNAFESPNADPLVDIQDNIFAMDNYRNRNRVNNDNGKGDSNLEIFTKLETDIALIYLVPGILIQVLQASLSKPIKGAVVVSFGNGNIPSDRQDIKDALKSAARREVLIVNVTQCTYGTVTGTYEAGAILEGLGVVNGGDMTIPASYTKLAYVLGQSNRNFDEKKQMMAENLKDELTDQSNDG